MKIYHYLSKTLILLVLFTGNMLKAQVQNITQATNHTTIQSAIAAANPGDIIECAAGTYNENVLINKNNITLRSVAGRSMTTIAGTFSGGNNASLAIADNTNGVTVGGQNQGFTIIGFDGTGSLEAAALYLLGAHTNIRIEGNEIVANGDHGLLANYNAAIDGIYIKDNIFSGKTFMGAEPGGCGFSTQFDPGNNVPRQLVTLGGGAGVTNSKNVYFTNNQVIGITGGYNSTDMCEQGNQLVTIDVIGSYINNNVFNGTTSRGSHSFRGRGPFTNVSCNTFESDNLSSSSRHIFFGSSTPLVGATPSTLSGVATQNSFPDGGAYLTPDNAASWIIYKDVAQATTAATTIGAGQTAIAASALTLCPVTNINTGIHFITIQAAINDVQTLTGHTIEIGSGNYDEQVLVTKGVSLKGVGMTQPVVNFTGTVSGKPTLMDVSANGATIENIHFNVDLSKLRSAVIASAADLDNITVKDNIIDAYGTPAGSYGDRNAVSINYGGFPTNYRTATGGVNNVVFTGNTVNGTGPASYFRSGLSLDEGGGTMTGNTITSINHDLLVRFAGNGPVTISGNNCNGGGVELSDQNAASGLISVSGNTFTGAGAPGTAVLRIKNNYNSIVHNITNNNFNGYEWGISLENANSINLDGNTFTTGSATAKAIVVNTKSISSNSNTIVQVPVAASFLNNNFNGTGIGILFANHDSDNDSYGTFVLGTPGNENNFASSLTSFITLDMQTGSTNGSTFPVYPNTGGWPTTMDYWALDMDATNNKFDVGSGLQLPTAMTVAQLLALEGKVFHKMDVTALGLVLTKSNNVYVMPALTPSSTDNDYTRIKNAIEAVDNNFTINLNGTFDWTEANAAASWALGNDGVNATGDDYSILVPANLNGVTFTAPLGIGTATIKGPGDLPGANLEGVLYFEGGDNQNWTISNMTFTDFDMSIGMFFGVGGTDAFNNTNITGNIFNMATDLNATVAPADVNQNIGIHFAFGANQSITNNTFNIAGDGVSNGSNFSTSVAMQSNTSGGSVYNGLNISGNIINILNAQSANPQVVLGIWENGHAHTSNISINNNQFLNLSGSNNASLNLQRAFRVTSHSGAGSTVSYSGNTIQGANIGFQWIAGSNFSSQLPVQMTGNTISGNNVGVLLQSNGKAHFTGNIFDGGTDNASDVQVTSGSIMTSGGGNSWAGDNYYLENLSTTSINVSGETFDQANNYRRADKMLDILDNGTSGLIRFDGTNLYVSAPGTGLSDETLTNAINASSAGNVINVETGTYTSGIDASLKAVTLSPGSSPGCVTIGGNMVLTGDDELMMEANGTTPCTGYDQFIVNGTVTLGGANLNLTLGYSPVNGDQIMLIDNDMADAVTGQFAQGNSISVGGYHFLINYSGGDGNDVVLTACTNVTNTNTMEVFCSIQEAIDDAQTLAGHSLVVNAGTYNEDVTVNKALTIIGAGIDQSYVYGPIGGNGATFTIASNGIVLDGFTISRIGNTLVDWNNPGLNTAGIAIQGQGNYAEVRNCKLIGNRTGIDINNSNGNNIHNNIITFNRTGMIFRNQTDNTLLNENEITDNWTVGVLFLDGSGGSNVPLQQAINSSFNNNLITGNWYGQIVDRQSGGSLPAPGTVLKNFECNWYGSTSPVYSTANSSEPGYAAQIPVAYGGAAVPPGGQPDILGPASANFDYTPFLANGTDNDMMEIGFQPVPNSCYACPSGLTIINTTTLIAYCDIQAALDASTMGQEIHVTAGTGSANFQVMSGKVLVIDNGVTLTTDGPVCNNGTITVNTGATYNNASTYSGSGSFNGLLRNITGGIVKPGTCN